MTRSEKELRATLQLDPGDPAFVEYAEYLSACKRTGEALEVCIAGLSASPSNFKGRLKYAKLLFERGYIPFAQREIEILCKALPENEPLQKLFVKLGGKLEGGSSSSKPQDSTVAEAEFDFGDIELIEESNKN